MNLDVLLSGAIGIAGTAVGAGLTYVLGLKAWRKREVRRELQLARSIRAEVNVAITSRVTEIPESLRKLARIIEKSFTAGNPSYSPGEFLSFDVFEANAGRIAALESPLPERIVEFYTNLASAYDDLGGLHESGWVQTADDFELTDAQKTTIRVQSFRRVADTFEEVIEEGRQLVELLDSAYPTSS